MFIIFLLIKTHAINALVTFSWKLDSKRTNLFFALFCMDMSFSDRLHSIPR